MHKPISDQVIVIVGASSGIGLLTAREAARRGARVVLAARNGRDLDSAVDEIRRGGGEAFAAPTDVADYDQVVSLARQAFERYGRIDTWISCAAVSLYAPFTETSLEDFRRILDVNFMGQVHGARAALPYLEESEGALICIGSSLSDRGVPLQGAYCASKHAIKGWLDSLRVELRKAGSPVRVTLVKPSSFNTPLFNKAKTRMGVVPRPIAPIYDPDVAAGAILRAAEGKERDLYLGGAGKLFAVLERISPSLLDLHQLWTGFDAQRTDWPKGEDAPNNLYAPVEYDGGVRGDFTRDSTDRSMYQALHSGRRAAFAAAAALVALGALALREGARGGETPERDLVRRARPESRRADVRAGRRNAAARSAVAGGERGHGRRRRTVGA